MLKKLEQYLTARYLRFDEDQIWFGKERIVLYFTPHLATEFLVNKDIYGFKYCASMFLAGRQRGIAFVQKHGVPIKKFLTPVVQISCDVLNMFGFGTFRTLKVDEKEGFMVLVGKSTFAEEIKKNFQGSETPVDFMLGGLFAGALQYYVKKPMYAVETMCVAQREIQECVWVVGTQEQIRQYVEKISPERLDWMNKILEQIKSLENEIEKTKGEISYLNESR